MTAEYKAGDRVIVNTKNVKNKRGTIGEGRNGNFYLGKLDDGRSFQATSGHLTLVKVPESVRHEVYNDVFKTLPEVSQRLVTLLASNGPQRTDALAKVIGADCTNTASLMMHLVRNGFVSYTARRHAGEYAEWRLSDPYKECLQENLRKRTEVPPPQKVKVEEYILWCPTSQLPPAVTYPTLAKAKEVAAIMAQRHPGQEFKICGIVGSAQVVTEQVTTEVTTLKVTGA